MFSIREDVLMQNFLNSLYSCVRLMRLLVLSICQSDNNLEELISLEITLGRRRVIVRSNVSRNQDAIEGSQVDVFVVHEVTLLRE